MLPVLVNCSPKARFPTEVKLQNIMTSQLKNLDISGEQEARLSQRDCAAGSISFGQKWKNGTDRQYFADIFNHCDIIGLQSYRIQ